MFYLSGTADLRVADEMGTLLRALHQHALDTQAECISVDLRELEFMNSSCFKAFVSWIANLQELPSEKQYRVKLLSSPAMLWQRRSLHALSCFAQHLVSVERIEAA